MKKAKNCSAQYGIISEQPSQNLNRNYPNTAKLAPHAEGALHEYVKKDKTIKTNPRIH